jgi:hypothetical protein
MSQTEFRMTARNAGEAAPRASGFAAVVRKCLLGLLGILLTAMAIPENPMLLMDNRCRA